MSIERTHNIISFYNNPAGYLKEGVATIDTMFRCEELSQWLGAENIEARYKEGVFEKLALNRKYYEIEEVEDLKNVRVWQLRHGFDVDCRFVSYAEMLERHGEPCPQNYTVVFDGELPTNNLEEIYAACNLNHPNGYEGHSLSMSDVVELYDENGSTFHYVDRVGFQEIEFSDDSPVMKSEEPNMEMW